MQGGRISFVQTPFAQALFVRMWFAVALREPVQKHCRAASLELATVRSLSLRVRGNAPLFFRNSGTNSVGYPCG